MFHPGYIIMRINLYQSLCGRRAALESACFILFIQVVKLTEKTLLI